MDSGAAKTDVLDYMRREGCFRAVEARDPERFRALAERAQTEVSRRLALYQQLATLVMPDKKGGRRRVGALTGNRAPSSERRKGGDPCGGRPLECAWR